MIVKYVIKFCMQNLVGSGMFECVCVCVQCFIYGFEFDGRGNSKVWC